jgi:uncharacterized protein YydD (DUF2326 family)
MERQVDAADRIYIHQLSPNLDWDTKLDNDSQRYILLTPYKTELEKLFFGFVREEENYLPSFRELISYYIRRDIDGYKTPLNI